jgi:protein-disulfide isomerase
VRAGLGRLPLGVEFGHVAGGAALSGIGFTVSLLIAGLAFTDPVDHDRAVVGILIAAVLATAVGWVAFRAAAILRGQTDADLPRRLDQPVDPRRDPIRGPAEAPITVVEYGDYECPFCAAVTGVADELRARFGNDIRYVFRQLPLTDLHPHAELAARAAVAAQAQGRFWDMHDTLFAHADRLEYEDLAGYAADLGLDLERFLRDLEADHTAARVREDIAGAEASGARGTPTFFINDVRHTGPHDAETMTRALRAAQDSTGVGTEPRREVANR